MVAECSLSKIATITMGTSPKGDTYNQNGEGIPLLNGPTEFGSVHPQCTLFTTKSVRESQSGDLIFCVRGSTTGRMNWADRVYSLGRGVCSIRGESVDDTRFIRYCLDWKLESLLKLAGGGTFPNLTQDTIRSFKIPFPEHRRKIASILSAYDDLIENNLRRIKTLEEMAQALYREWFVKFRFLGHEKVRMVDSPLGKIPEGWEVKTINDVVETLSGFAFKSKTFTKSGNYKVITIKNVKDGFFIDDSDSQVDQPPLNMPKHCNLDTGDILLSLTGNVGRACLVFGNNFLLNQRVAKLVPRIKSNRGFVYFMYREEDTKLRLEMISTGVAQQNLSPVNMGKITIIRPVEEILSVFSEIAEPICNEIISLNLRNANLRQTRDLLLPRLISGDLDVSDLEINIPEEAA